ncbi:IQ motif [Macleaya cordata]|uniref:IQ motif n=1 Tax=Macleaya cordata TaxID=56857 RepID=A0A200Q8B3_MACCD|nr:IQ motif [Macleaya cordata]
MMPINRYMDYPQYFQGTHIPYPYHNYPSWIPPQTKAETTKSPAMFEPWFYGSSYGFPNPAECHGCCNHGQPFGYYNWKPPHSHLPPPPPFYHHGPYSSYVDLHPPHYFPPHYAMEQPRFEIDKGMLKNHCCGCPNHTCNGKEEKGVKIEEHDPEVEKKESDPLGLTRVKNHPYPILWVPPEYMRNRAASKPSESEPKLSNGWFPFDMRNDKESSKNSDLGPKVWNGWSPFDVNSIRSLGQDGHKDRKQNQQNEEREGQIPHPIIWMPVYDKPEEVEKINLKECNPSSKDSEEPKKKYTIIPVRFPYNVSRGPEEGVVKDTSQTGVQSKVKENEMEDKRILVKLIEEGGEKKSSEENKKDSKSISLNQAEETGDKKPSSNENAKRRSPSPSKANKLPPVCLRVDPLPRRKSRSPSPPSHKEKVVKVVDGTSKSSSPPDNQEVSTAQDPICNIENEVKQQKKERKVVEVEERMSGQGKKQDSANTDQVPVPITIPPVSNKEISGETTTEKAEMGVTNKVEEGAKEVREQKEVMTKRKNFSSAEAAVRIQSTYRGYEVRKWEPLKKLRQIARVREQVNEVRTQILGLESSNIQKNEKQRVFISETIMNLLLQLDTIQGLHPSVRDFRKSVARELVCLQEKLDSLTSQKDDGLTLTEAGEEPHVKPAGEENSEFMQAGLIEESQDSELEKNLSMGTDDSCGHMTDIITKTEESEQQLLDVPGSRTEEVVCPLVLEAQANSDVQPTATKSDKESLHLGDDCEEPLACANMNNEVKDEDLHSESKVMLEAQKVNDDIGISKEHVCNALVADDKSDVVPDELSALPVEQVSDSYIGVGSVMSQAVDSSVVNKAFEHHLSDFIAEALDKDSTISSEEEIEKSKSGKLEGCVSGEAESKFEEPLGQENREEEMELEEVFKREEQLVKEKNYIEEHPEVPKMCDADANLKDVNNLPSESVDSGASSIEVMEAAERTKEDKSETFAAENEVPKVEEMITGQSSDNLSEDISEELIINDREDIIEDLEEAIADKDKTADCCPGTEVIEAKAIDLAPESAAEEKDKGDTSSPGTEVVEAKAIAVAPESAQEEEKDKGDTSVDAGVNVHSVDESEEKNNLVKENEQLRDMLEKLIKAGNDQLSVISDLNGRVKDLERKLMMMNRKLRMRRPRARQLGLTT